MGSVDSSTISRHSFATDAVLLHTIVEASADSATNACPTVASWCHITKLADCYDSARRYSSLQHCRCMSTATLFHCRAVSFDPA